MVEKDKYQVGDELSIQLKEDGWHGLVRRGQQDRSEESFLLPGGPFKTPEDTLAALRALVEQ